MISIKKPDILSPRSNEILTAVIHGARKEEPSHDVQLAAIHALYNSLEFVRENFEREVSRIFLAISNLQQLRNFRGSEIISCKLCVKQHKMPPSLSK